MKCLIASVFTNSGIAKGSGNPYSMTRAVALVPFNGTETSNYQSRGVGFTAVEMSVNSNCATQIENEFNRLFDGTPVFMDLVTTLDRESRNVIMGLESSPESAKPKASAFPIGSK